MPRLTMSVAMSISMLRCLKPNITTSRSLWSKSECIAAQLYPLRFNITLSSFTRCLEETKTITRSGGCSVKMCFKIGVLSLSRQIYTLWSIFSAGLDTAIFTSTGLCIISRAILAISGGIVAENRIVCLLSGSCFNMVLMSSKNPISRIRSASSRMMCVVRERSRFPNWRWEMRRPGVATIISAPWEKALRSCSNLMPSFPP